MNNNEFWMMVGDRLVLFACLCAIGLMMTGAVG